MKLKVVNVEPISNKAKNRFSNMMNGCSTVFVEQENDKQMFLASENQKYFFWVNKVNDPDWKLAQDTPMDTL